MNELIVLGTSRTMDSREIAGLLNTTHTNIIRSIENELPKVGCHLKADTYKNEQNGQTYRCYKLPYRETMILVSGYSVELRTKVIDRWMDLEHAKLKPVSQFDMMRQQIQMLEDQDRRLKIVEAKLETSQMDFYTIAAYCSLRGRKVDISEANAMGRRATKLSAENDYSVGKVSDQRYGTVNTYHTDILAMVVN